MTETAHTYSITSRRLIRANQERVFNAFSNSKSLSKWFTPHVDIAVEVLIFEFTTQGNFRLQYTMLDGTYPVVGGTYYIIERPHQIVFSWVWEAPDIHANIPTQVSIQFIKKGELTEVVISHERLPSQEACTRYTQGWDGTLDQLQNMIETNTPKTTEKGIPYD